MQSDRNRLLVGITYNRITLNKLAFNRLFSPDPLEFVRGSAALPSHTWNLRGCHTLSGGVPCSRCVFTFKSMKLCQGTAACINKSPSRSARYVSLSLGWWTSSSTNFNVSFSLFLFGISIREIWREIFLFLERMEK